MRALRNRWSGWLLLGLAGAWPASAQEASAPPAGDAALTDRVRALEDELAVLRRKLEVKEEDDANKASTAALASADRSGFQIQSPDRKSYRLRLRSYAQADSRSFLQRDPLGPTTRETFALRRARLVFDATLAEWIDARLMPDFAGGTTTLQDAYINVHPWKLAQLQLGKYKAPFSLERLQSATALTFIERGFPTQLAPNRDLGVTFGGDLREGLLTYQLAVMNGVIDGGSADNDADNEKDFVGRVWAQPFQETAFAPLQGLGLGFAYSVGDQDRVANAIYRTSGQDPFFVFLANVREAGRRERLGPQAYYTWGPLTAIGEWTQSKTHLASPTATGVADVRAWQVGFAYVLTGEAASYRGVVPSTSFRPDLSGLGAFEVAARYHRWEVGDDVFTDGFANPDVSASEASAFTVGVNWYVNPVLKVAVDYERTEFDGGGAAGTDRVDESLLLTRFQISY
jgi:phosphate-selective porin OprO/OprP